MIQAVRDAIVAFRRDQFATDAAPELTELSKYVAVAEEDLERTDYASEAVYNAFALHLELGKPEDRTRCLEILRAYLDKDLDVEEEAWARWNAVDSLARLRRCAEVVATQTDFLNWSKTNLDPEWWRWVMFDGTQAMCWFQAGHGDDWMRIFYELKNCTPPTSANRYHRFSYLRSASHVLSRFRRTDEAVPIVHEMLDIASEGLSWYLARYAELEGYIGLVELNRSSGDRIQMGLTASLATNKLEELSASLPDPEAAQVLEPPPPHELEPSRTLRYPTSTQYKNPVVVYREACHDLGSALYRAKEYAQALPLFENAMAWGIMNRWSAKCYAACLWATTKDRPKVDAFIAKATPVFDIDEAWWKGAPELADFGYEAASESA